jgi:hypothetical protein
VEALQASQALQGFEGHPRSTRGQASQASQGFEGHPRPTRGQASQASQGQGPTPKGVPCIACNARTGSVVSLNGPCIRSAKRRTPVRPRGCTHCKAMQAQGRSVGRAGAHAQGRSVGRAGAHAQGRFAERMHALQSNASRRAFRLRN